MNLSELQQLFKNALNSPTLDSETLKALKPINALSVEQGFGIYHRGFINRFTENLAKTYEAVKWVLGPELFEETARSYIQENPSVYFSINQYGETYPDFLVSYPKTKTIPFLFDLASFEWLLSELNEAPAPTPLSTEQAYELLQSEDCKVHFIDAMDLYQCDYAIYDIWRQRHQGRYRFENINWAHQECILLYKKSNNVLVQRIDANEGRVIQSLYQGHSLAQSLSMHANHLTASKISHFFELMLKTAIIEDILVIKE